ncbi:MAG TPA: acyl-CoA dehydrogenase family protein [Vicinamibacterales bacterium]|nr:acyl-CoA dehydrogenase family protein [Vicinamibacterales bacterium]
MHANSQVSSLNAQVSAQRGGEWLLQAADAAGVFTPEQLTEEHRLIARTAEEFITNEVLPVLDRLEQKDWTLARELVKKAASLGLLGVDVPEGYGGLGLDKVTSLIVSDRMSRSASFGATFGAQANLVIIPIALFGSEAQKQKYLPKLLTGELVGAYGLSETGSGSDALGARTRATRQPDGSFVLNGEKMWITNGGFADLFVVFARVDPSTGSGQAPSTSSGQAEGFTAFLVERGWGVKSGKEEHKMGLHGSSTTALIFLDVHVPAENVIGEVGKGHKVAFNVLNFARFKLGAMCAGGAANVIGESAKYAATRRQFNQPIGNFGAIKHKIGEMVAKSYAIESAIYRTAGLVDARIAATPPSSTGSGQAGDGSAAVAAFEEYAVESSIAKVAGSETLNYVLDENIQIHGGNGYVKDYPAERHFRDARVNRIFEGTNEINRLLIPGMLVRRALKGDLGLIAAAKALQDELLGPPSMPPADAAPLAEEARAVAAFKKTALMVLGLAMQTFGNKLTDEQEVLMHAADILIDTFSAESAVLRAQQAAARGDANAALHEAAARVFVNDAALRVDASARQALAATVEGDTLRTMVSALRRLIKVTPINTVRLRRELADHAIAKGGYIFG